jgi:hypothetical protein
MTFAFYKKQSKGILESNLVRCLVKELACFKVPKYATCLRMSGYHVLLGNARIRQTLENLGVSPGKKLMIARASIYKGKKV